MFASELIRALNASGVSQRIAVLHAPGPIALDYDAPTTLMGSDGLATRKLPINPRRLGALRRLLLDSRVDVVQAHGGEALKYCIPATAALGIPVVYRRWGSSLRQGGRRVVHGWLMRRSDRVVAVAEAIRRETIQVFGVPSHRIVTISNARDAGALKPVKARPDTRRSLGIPSTAPVLLSVGSLAWEKDPIAQVALADRVLRQQPEAAYVMAGDGPLRAEVEAEIGSRGLEGRVLILGVRTDVADLLAASDVLVLASRSEGLPGIAIEAGMIGLPVVAYAVGGVPEIVLDGTTGLLAPPANLDILGDRVLQLLGDADARGTMGRKAKEWCLSRFEIHAIAPRYLELYEDVIGRPLPAPVR